ncbi:hypothetical protein E4U28_008121 [Claviceps purpurea]|nr:hypothetical protein E4U28_008121 [Claviceps purpurea]
MSSNPLPVLRRYKSLCTDIATHDGCNEGTQQHGEITSDLVNFKPPLAVVASSPTSYPKNRVTAATSPTSSMKDEPERRKEADSTESPTSTASHNIAVPSIEVDGQIDDDFDLYSIEDDGAASSVLSAHTYERGRRYSTFGDGLYPIPNDEMEQQREDLQHAMLMMLMENKLFLAPIGDHPQKILDIGTGTGIWAIEVGDKYPSAKVRGIDITPIQPKWVPPNVLFIIDDCELDWLEKDIDFAHFRFTIAVLKDTSKVLGHAFESLRPGGWLELQELQPVPMCDDGTMPDNDPVKYIFEVSERAFGKFGMKITLPAKLEPYLLEAGFENLHCQIKKVPIGPWAKNTTMRKIGLCQKTAVAEFLPACAGRPFKALDMSEAEAEVTVALARKGLDDPDVHRYFYYYFWYAQKPESS